MLLEIEDLYLSRHCIQATLTMLHYQITSSKELSSDDYHVRVAARKLETYGFANKLSLDVSSLWKSHVQIEPNTFSFDMNQESVSQKYTKFK